MSAASVLADRIAAALVHREPGWRLPRRSALARRYNVSIAEIDSAITELARRSLIRRLPDGQLYRASAAEYLIPVEGVTGLATRLDPMGGHIVCQTRHVSRRAASQDVAGALGLADGDQVRIVRCVWFADGEPAAISTAYVPEEVADAYADSELPTFGALLAPGRPQARPTAVDLELVPPQPSIARSLRLPPGQSAMTVTIRFTDSEQATALTIVIMKPDMFRIALEASAG
jgi:GntR family transcriptional regulator, phosphonate transport system regulatory protein